MMYIVRFTSGQWDDFGITDVFVTDKKSKATKYVTKFNKILKKWKGYYAKFEDDKGSIKWILDEHIDQHFNRWCQIRDINRCYWEEIEVR